jgi:hypothetical protein
LLKTFVGPVGLYGDVNDILKDNLAAYKQFVETVDVEALREARSQDREGLRNVTLMREEEFPVSNALSIGHDILHAWSHCRHTLCRCMPWPRACS